jgi:MFS family permease
VKRAALLAAGSMIIMTSGSTAASSLFVVYRSAWGLTSADIALAFSTYVFTLLPVLLLFGSFADRVGRRPMMAVGAVFMTAGLCVLIGAHGLAEMLVARCLQGVGVGLSIGAVTAALAESYDGRIAPGSIIQIVSAIGLVIGPVISAVTYDLGSGLNLAYIPGTILVASTLLMIPFVAERVAVDAAAPAAAAETPFSPAVVRGALRFALPLVFVSWASLSLYFSLVPSYLAASLHAADPLIGAFALVASQTASVLAVLRFGTTKQPERAGMINAAIMLGGLVLLVIGTATNIWAVIVLATVLVGAGSGLAAAAAFGIAGRVGRGQRARIFAHMYVLAYLGYSLPSLTVGYIAARASFDAGFITVIVALAAICAALPLLRHRGNATVCPTPAAV